MYIKSFIDYYPDSGIETLDERTRKEVAYMLGQKSIIDAVLPFLEEIG